ncbi:hypothetical protein AB0E01_32900 [Nocardia vinacea]|uniref:hypothetical protein n=1 Tax=Nocardia vinacea TaxID=96468 RepID=UPI0033CFFDB6
MGDRHYRMDRPEYRNEARENIYDSRVRDLNEFVDGLRARKPDQFIPYISPEFGGSSARLLLLTLSPGEKTRLDSSGGSGFLSTENTDPAAFRIAEAMDSAGIARTDCVGWNAYPWYVHGLGGMRAERQDPFLREGIDLLIQVIARLPELRAVFVFGRAPERAWGYFGKEYPRTRRSLAFFYHRSTGPKGYQGTKLEQIEWRRELFESMTAAKRAIEETSQRGRPISRR